MINTSEYLILVEGDNPTNCSAWSPDLPGCVAVGATLHETVRLMHEAIELHLAGMAEDGQPAPPASGPGVYVDARLVVA